MFIYMFWNNCPVKLNDNIRRRHTNHNEIICKKMLYLQYEFFFKMK